MNINNLPKSSIIFEPVENTSQLKSSALENENFKDANHRLEKIDKYISLLGQDPSASMLSIIANHQQQLVLSIVSNINSEFAIGQMLAQGIEALGAQLEDLQAWTDGGVDMFGAALKEIYEKLIENGIKGMELEDLFQVALLEILSNPEEYGLSEWYENNKDKISHILESTGSGSHGLHESDYDTAGEMAQVCKEIFESLLTFDIPEDSFLGKVLSTLKEAGGPGALSDQIKNHYYDESGWWAENPAKVDSLSPMLRLFLLSEVLAQNPKLTQEQVELFLNGSLSDINAFINAEFNVDNALVFLTKNSTWAIQYNDPKAGGRDQIDWRGDGIGLTDLESMYENFPERQLTDEEVKKLENISDQIKMLQETLKYWLSIIRDNGLSIARNI